MSAALSSLRPRRIKEGIVFDLTIGDLLTIFEQQQGLCALSGMPLTWQRSANQSNDWNISIDRIDSVGSYTRKNVHLVAKAFNFMRARHSINEFVVLCHRIASRYPLE